MADSSTSERSEPKQQPPAGRSAAERQEELLRQLTSLTESVQQLASRDQPAAAGSTAGLTPDPDTEIRRRVEFAYLFLGEVLGRRGALVFGVPRVAVTRDNKGLTFADLRGGTAARVRAANGTTDLLENLRPNVAVATSIPGGQPIDSLVVLESRDGVALALGPCLPPLIIVD